jgi:hypothetical protein
MKKVISHKIIQYVIDQNDTKFGISINIAKSIQLNSFIESNLRRENKNNEIIITGCTQYDENLIPVRVNIPKFLCRSPKLAEIIAE